VGPRMLFALLVAALLVPTSARAQHLNDAVESPAERAARVHQEHCTAVAAGSSEAASVAIQEVNEVWLLLSREFDRDPRAYLLYWRGVLAQCLSQETRAMEDLARFVDWYREADATARGAYHTLDFDGRKRLRRLRGSSETSTTPGVTHRQAPIAAAGIVGLVAGGVFGGLAAWQADETQRIRQTFIEPAENKDFEALLEQGHGSHQASIGLAIGAGAAAAVGAVLLPISSQLGAKPAVTLVPVVWPGKRYGFAVGGRW
jgi:hypothetical protein